MFYCYAHSEETIFASRLRVINILWGLKINQKKINGEVIMKKRKSSALSASMMLIMLILLSSISSMAQPNPQWVRSFNNTNANDNDVAQKSVVDASGNVYVIAYSKGTNTGYDFLTLKYNAAGDLLWSRRYNNDAFNGTDDPNDITVDNNGNVYVIGSSNRDNIKSDAVLIKYSASGTQQWVWRSNFLNHSFADDAEGVAVTVTPNGSYVYIAHDLKVYSFQGQNYIGSYVIKFNSAGDSLGYNGALSVENSVINLNIADIAVDNNDNLYSMYNYNNNIQVVKYNSALLNQLWSATYDGDSSEYGVEMKISPDGHCVATGRSFKINQGYDYITLKLGRDNGAILWEKRYNNSQASLQDFPNSLTVDNNGNVIVTGSSMSLGNDNDILTLKYNSTGNLQWEKRYNGSANGSDQGRSVVTDNTGNVYVAGFFYKNAQAGFDFVTLKYSSSGLLDWAAQYALTSENDQPVSMGIDNAGNLYVIGRILRFLNTDEDVAIIKYASTVGIQQISGEIPQKFSLEQNYPNPFNPVTNIKFSIPKAGIVKLVVFDAAGRQVSEPVNQQLEAGSYNYDFNAAGLSSGVYFYRIQSGEFSEVKKMMLVK
jgi:hypothetical protein